MRRALAAALCALLLAVPGARAQTAPDLVRFEWITGVLFQGDMAAANFQLDTTPFGGPLIERSDGALDVDPALWFGLRGHWRLADRVSVSASWMHSEAQYRVLFPALASDPGDFDLEALILAGFDFQTGGQTAFRAEKAMSDAITDVYLASVRYEVPVSNGWVFPFVNVGAGIFKQVSEGNVFHLEFEGDPPPSFESSEILGIDPLGSAGISLFGVNETNLLLSLGGGLRVSFGRKWGAQIELEDLARFGTDFTYIDEASTPPPDAASFRLYQTEFFGKEGVIHNVGIRLSVNYAVWPRGAPR